MSNKLSHVLLIGVGFIFINLEVMAAVKEYDE